MNKLLTTIALTCTLALVSHAAEGDAKKSEETAKKHPAPTAEQKAIRKELIEKYDTNKNKRLDKDERAKMTPADAEKWQSVSPARREKAKPAPAETK